MGLSVEGLRQLTIFYLRVVVKILNDQMLHDLYFGIPKLRILK